MPKIKLPDLTDVEDVGEFNDVPKGLYVFKIREITESETGETSKNPGQPMGVVVLDPVRIVGGKKIKSGEYQGLFHRFPLDDTNPGWTPRLKEFVVAVGGKLKGWTLDPSKLEGKLVIGKVRDGKDQGGERRAELDRLMPYTEEAAGGSAGADDVDDDDDGDDDLWTREELEEASNDELVEAAEELEVDVPSGKLTSKKKAALIDSILEAQEEEDEDDEGDEDDDGDDDESYEESDLMEMGKDELAEVAGEFEVEFPNRLTTAARKRVVAAILEAQDGDEDEDDDDDEDGDEDEYTREDLEAMDAAELKEAAEEVGADVPSGKLTSAKKKKLIDAILEAQEEADEDDEDGDDDDEDDDGYDDMTKTQLAKECRSRGIKVRKGMSEDAMREALRENDAEDDDDDDDDEEMDPDTMDIADVKAALRERGIAVKGSEKVLRNKLTKALDSDDDGDPF